jgi:WXG100 family type VII secretion target
MKGVTMGAIQADTDTLRRLGQLYVQVNNEIRDTIGPQIHSLTTQLETSWQGHSRARYDSMYNDWASRTNVVIQIGEDIGRHLQNVAAQLEQADQV